MLSRVDVRPIAFAHLRTLRKLGQPGINPGDLWLFFWWPAILALPLAFFFTEKLGERSSDLLTAVSIIGGFLFGLLAMITQVIEEVKKEALGDEVKKVFAKEVHSNIAFGILQSLACVVLLIVLGFFKPNVPEHPAASVTVAKLPGPIGLVKSQPLTVTSSTATVKSISAKATTQAKVSSPASKPTVSSTLGWGKRFQRPWQEWLLMFIAWVNYFSLMSFLLTLLMIVNRIFVIMSSEAEEL